MKRILFYLSFIIFCFSSFSQNKNIVFREAYKYNQIQQIDLELYAENVFASLINGDQIIVEIGTNNNRITPEVKMQNEILSIKHKNLEYSKGDSCNIYIYSPANFIPISWKIKTKYGNINCDGLNSDSLIDVAFGEGKCEIKNIKTIYLNTYAENENLGLSISNLECEYFDIKGFVGPVNISLKNAPQAKSVITTKYGDINLSLPIDQNFEISARSNKSTFTNNFAKTKKAAPDWVNYTHNQGGPLIQLQTFQGDITVGE